MPRHRHLDAYASIVLDGGYDQFAYAGHLRAEAGAVLIQPTLDCHADRMLSHRLRLLRLPWPREVGLGGVYRVPGLELIVRVADHDVTEAAGLLAEAIAPAAPQPGLTADCADLLAAALRDDPGLSIGRWASAHGLVRETVSRRFLGAYGVTPARFRAELRGRQAWLQATGSRQPLAAIAAELGFADQAHMTRAIGAMTGDTPARWRRRLALAA